MKIFKMIDSVSSINNKNLSVILYKIYKIVLNILYPIMCNSKYGIDEKSEVIVSLTTFPERINTVWLTINTILNQSVKPKSIILWLAEDQFPNGENSLPERLRKLKKNGLTIRFCDNLYSHKKYYYTMKENPEMSIVTIDDDILYPETLIEDLLSTSVNNPGAICCTWGHVINYMDNGCIAPYQTWLKGVNDCRTPTIQLVPIGCGGVLYPPHSLDKEVFKKNEIKRLCSRVDDLWLKSMAVKNDTPAVRVNKDAKIYFTILSTQSKGLHFKNVGENRNDISMRNILNFYPEVEKKLYLDYKNRDKK